jgi:hypothetical protein
VLNDKAAGQKQKLAALSDLATRAQAPAERAEVLRALEQL